MHRITTFGGVQVHDDDGELQSFRSRKHVALLVYLRSNPRRVHLRENVARMFWETDSSLARHSLSQALYDIRSTLGQVVSNVPGDALRIESDRLAFDVGELERAIKSGDLPTAVDLYTAPFAPDLDRAGTGEFERWLERERSRLAVLGQSALRQYLTYADKHGEWGEMCSAALRLIRMNPLDEEAHRALMRGLWLHGDQTSALEHFHEVRERLEGELPEGLSEETLELVRRIEGSRPQASRGEEVRDRMIPLVGRQQELSVLARFAEEAATEPDSLIIEGEAGIGKTRLVEELENLLILEGHVVLTSQCYAAEAEVAYGPVLDGLREIAEQVGAYTDPSRYLELGRLFPNTGAFPSPEAPADGQSARRRLFEEIADMLRRHTARESRSIIWILEDVHNVDGASSALLHYLARRLVGEPFRLVLTSRPENEQKESARQLLSEECFVEHGRRCEVGPLSSEAVRKLVAAVTGEPEPDPSVVERVNNLSGGNPFYAVEVLRLDPDLSSSADMSRLFKGRLRAVLRSRVQGLPSEAVRVLEAVSVLGSHARPGHVVKICGFRWPDFARYCDDLISHDILREAGQSLEFSHEIVREFIYTNIGLVTRSALHLQAGEILASTGQGSSSRIARHFWVGGDSFRAFEYAIQAARIAQAKAGFSEATEMATLALEVASSGEQRVKALEAYVEASRASGLLEDARAGIRQITEALEPTDTPDLWLEYQFQRIEILLDLANWDAAERVISELRRSLNTEDFGTDKMLAPFRLNYLDLSLSVRSNLDRRADAVAATLEKVLSTAEASLPINYVAEANYSLAGYAAFYQSAEKAKDYLLSITERDEYLTSEQRIRNLLFLGGIYTKMGEWDKAKYNLESALDLTTSRHDVVDESAVWNNLGCMFLEMGEWRDAERCFSKAVTLQQVAGSTLATRLHSDVNMANILFYRGEPRRANKAYRECFEFLQGRSLDSFKPEISACVGLTALQCGDLDTALSCGEYLKAVSDNELRGIQERYKIDWLLAFLANRLDEGFSARDLSRVVRQIESTDLIGALKLRWIASLINGLEESQELLGKELRRKGLFWFMAFSRRWLKSADCQLHQRPTGSTRTKLIHF